MLVPNKYSLCNGYVCSTISSYSHSSNHSPDYAIKSIIQTNHINYHDNEKETKTHTWEKYINITYLITLSINNQYNCIMSFKQISFQKGSETVYFPKRQTFP